MPPTDAHSPTMGAPDLGTAARAADPAIRIHTRIRSARRFLGRFSVFFRTAFHAAAARLRPPGRWRLRGVPGRATPPVRSDGFAPPPGWRPRRCQNGSGSRFHRRRTADRGKKFTRPDGQIVLPTPGDCGTLRPSGVLTRHTGRPLADDRCRLAGEGGIPRENWKGGGPVEYDCSSQGLKKEVAC